MSTVMISAVSTIQIWTLIVAGLAAIFSLGSAIYTGWVSQRSEHRVWQRDLRVRIYSECTAVAEEFITLLTSFSANAHRTYRDQASHNEELEHLTKVRQFRIDLVNKINEVQTFGANEVSSAGFLLGQALLHALDVIVNDPVPDLNTVRAELAKPGSSLVDFRSSVRKSLKISDE